jgi:hypothetical protein
MFGFRQHYKPFLIAVLGLLVWAGIHVPAIFYGTHNLPLHQSYIGDEQSPVNGALHILESKSPLGLRNLPTVYYGPIFSVIALPGIVIDLGTKWLTGAIHSAADYKNYILWDWGGIVWKERLLSVIVGFLGLLAFYKLLMTETVNPGRGRTFAIVGVLILAFNFYFFEYTSFFRHWIYVVSALLAQMYFLVRIIEDRTHKRRYYIWQGILFIGTFGISYLPVLSQIIFLPALIVWLKQRDKEMLRAFGLYVLCLIIPILLLIWWHPRAFLRLIHLTGGDLTGLGSGGWTSEPTIPGFSFGYYLKIIVTNHISLLLVWIMLLLVAIRNKDYKNYLFWMPISAAIFYFVVFGLFGHHESRYILPALVSMIVSVAILLVRYFTNLPRALKILTVIFLAIYFIYHLTTIFYWSKLMQAGPKEQQAIARALAYQSEHPNSKQLFIAWYLLGYPHTKIAYEDYLNNYVRRSANTTGGDLYEALLSAPYPKGVTPLNVFYLHPDASSSIPGAEKKFDRVVVHHWPTIDKHLDPDSLEINLTRYWNPSVWIDSFETIKENNTVVQ